MNYITEIKAFNEVVLEKSLSTGQIALWYALMYHNNKCAWIEWFSVPNIMLELHTGLSRQGIQKARNILKQCGLIDFKPNGTKATLYKIATMSNSFQDSCQDSFQDSCQDSFQVGCQVGCQVGSTLNKHKPKLKQKLVKENIKEKATRFSPPTLSEVQAYCDERKNNVDAERFIDYYTSNGWCVGKNKMKDWKASVRTWEKSAYEKPTSSKKGLNNYEEKKTLSDIDKEMIIRRREALKRGEI